MRHEQSDSLLNDAKFLILTQMTLQRTRNPKIVRMKNEARIVMRQMKNDFGGFKGNRHNFVTIINFNFQFNLIED